MPRYVVDIDLVVNGNPGAKISGLTGHAKGLADEFGKVGTKFVDGFTGAVEKVGSMMAGVGKIGIGAAVGAATYGVVGLNNQLESTQVSLAAVLNANGKSTGMAGAMEQAADWVKQMRKDAKELPGEFSDLLGIVQSGAGAAFNAGMDVPAFEAMAAQGMAAAKAMSVDIHQAGRELAMLLEGRAGGHNVFGTRLGIHAEGFNDKKPEERLKILTDALGKFQPAIKVFGDTFDAQSSTLIDNAKTFIGAATGPLFGKVKGAMAEANDWFDANQATVQDWAGRAGDFLVDAFDRGKSIFLEYGPLVLTFAGNARDKLISIWADMEPYVKKFGEYLKDFLGDSGSIDKLITLGKIYAAVKLGGGVGGLFGGFGKFGTVGAGVGAIGSSIQAGAMGYGIGAMTGVDGMSGYLGGAAAGGQMGYALGGPMGGAVGAGIGALFGEVTELNSLLTQVNDAHIGEYMGLMDHNSKLQDAHGMIDLHSREFANTVAEMQSNADWMTTIFGDVAANMATAALRLNNIALRAETAARVDREAGEIISRIDAGIAESKRKSATEAAASKRDKAVHGKGGTTIQKVEITVSSNQNPNQIARDVMSVIQDRRRYRPSSPRVQNWSAG